MKWYLYLNGRKIQLQYKKAEAMGDYFSTMANDIGGQHVLKLDEYDFDNHQSVKTIRHYYSDSHFQFKEIL